VTLRVFSFGGGVQSTAALVLAAERKIDFPVFVFANTGDDSEHPATLRYVREVATPYADRLGIELVAVQKTRFGQPDTLVGALERDNRSIGIPVRMSGTGAPGRRSCTLDFKIRPIARYLKRLGATDEAPAVLGLGISLDEVQRMRTASGIAHYGLVYPLIDRRMNRQDCVNTIERAGLPVPPKSSCWFCPFHSRAYWARQRREEPDLFRASARLERLLNDRRRSLSQGAVWFTDFLKPLDEAIGDQMTLDEAMGGCEGGYCHT